MKLAWKSNKALPPHTRMHIAQEIFAQYGFATWALQRAGFARVPNNLLLSEKVAVDDVDALLERLVVVLMDFEHTMPCSESQMKSGCLLPSDLHNGPKVKDDSKYGAEADWWTFAITLYQFMTGEPPFQGLTPAEFWAGEAPVKDPWTRCARTSPGGQFEKPEYMHAKRLMEDVFGSEVAWDALQMPGQRAKLIGADPEDSFADHPILDHAFFHADFRSANVPYRPREEQQRFWHRIAAKWDAFAQQHPVGLCTSEVPVRSFEHRSSCTDGVPTVCARDNERTPASEACMQRQRDRLVGTEQCKCPSGLGLCCC